MGRSPILVTEFTVLAPTGWQAPPCERRGELHLGTAQHLAVAELFEFPIENWYTYINKANERPFLESYRAAFRFHLELDERRQSRGSDSGEALSVRLDSRANLEHWKRRLEGAEIDRVRDLTFDVAPSYYSEMTGRSNPAARGEARSQGLS